MKKKFDSKGQTIIEAIVALAALLIVITAIATVVIAGLSNSQFVKNQSLANKYAQQGLELVHNIQTNDLSRFAAFTDGTYCINDSVNPPTVTTCAGDTVNTAGVFIRTVGITNGSDTLAIGPCSYNQTRIDVKVKWSSGKCDADDHFCHKANLVSCFYNSSDVSAP